MAEAAPVKKSEEHSFTADQLNWEQRVKTELESGRKWDENWGTLFSGGAPNDYKERIEYLENQLKSQKANRSTTAPAKYGVAPPFREITVGRQDFRRKKMFMDPDEDDI